MEFKINGKKTNNGYTEENSLRSSTNQPMINDI